MRSAVYAGSFDPPTNGHGYIIKTAAALFDELVVAIGTNPDKKPNFTVEERIAMLRASFGDISNLKVVSSGNKYLVDYARQVGATYMVRGMRDAADFEFEMKMRYVNGDWAKELTTVFLTAPREFNTMSSGFVRGLIGYEGWEDKVRAVVPEAVFNKLLEREKAKGSG
ncbi:MAG: pantetheine-phosphate adenylyltransferase [Patescibacteria group bacterium]